MTLPQRRTVITGLGVVTPVGLGAGPFWEALSAGRIGQKEPGLAVLRIPSGANPHLDTGSDHEQGRHERGDRDGEKLAANASHTQPFFQ